MTARKTAASTATEIPAETDIQVTAILGPDGKDSGETVKVPVPRSAHSKRGGTSQFPLPSVLKALGIRTDIRAGQMVLVPVRNEHDPHFPVPVSVSCPECGRSCWIQAQIVGYGYVCAHDSTEIQIAVPVGHEPDVTSNR